MKRELSHIKQIENKNKEVVLPKKLENFKAYIISKNYSVKTLESYITNLSLLFKFLKIDKNSRANKSLLLDGKAFKEANVSITNIGITFIRNIKSCDLANYFLFCSEILGNEASTKNTKIVIVKAFFKYLLIQEESIDKNVAEKIELPKLGKKNIIFMNIEESKKLLILAKNDTDNNEVMNKRNLCLIALMTNNGLRKEEIIGISIKDIFLDENYINIHGKGNKERVAYLNKFTHSALENYLIQRNKINNDINENDKDALFISERHNRISASVIENLVEKYINKAGINKNITPHKLRTSFAMRSYKNKVDLYTIASMMGHSSINTLKSYIESDEDNMRNAVNNDTFSDMII